MIKITIQSVVSRVREGRENKENKVGSEKNTYYADFLFLGGSLSVAIDSDQFNQLLPLLGQELVAVFRVNPRQIVFFDRQVSVFEAVKLLDINPVK